MSSLWSNGRSYRGFQIFRDCVSKKVLSSGIHKARSNTENAVLTREMPRLRIVEDWLWQAANTAIDARAPKSGTS